MAKYTALFAHFRSTNVKIGQKLKLGDIIGTQGNTGISYGDHCHVAVGNGSLVLDNMRLTAFYNSKKYNESQCNRFCYNNKNIFGGADYRVTTTFLEKEYYNQFGLPHPAIDIAANKGAKIHWAIAETGTVSRVYSNDSGYGNAVLVEYDTSSGGSSSGGSFTGSGSTSKAKQVKLSGTVYLYNANGERYPAPSTQTRTLNVLGETSGYYKVESSAFDPSVVYVKKGDVTVVGSTSSGNTSSKLPSTVKLVGTVNLYNVNGGKYPMPSTKTKTVKVLGEKGNYYKVQSSAFDPEIVYVRKSDVS